MRKYLLCAVAAGAVIAGSQMAFADATAAKKWIDDEFQPSTLSKDEQMSEMQWFIDAAKPYAGMEINVLSEGIPSESLHPNQQSLRGISPQSRREVLALFPELASEPAGIGDLARPSLKRHEAALLAGQECRPPEQVSFDC